MNKPQRARERALFRYRNAVERGDFDTVIAVLKMAERDSALLQMIEEMAELDEAPIGRPGRRITPLFQKSKGITEVVIRRDPSLNGWPPIPDQGEEESDMFTTYVPTRSPYFAGARKQKWDPITLAAAILIVAVLGMVLLFMRAAFNPGAGGAPEESLPEFAAQPGECDLSMDHLLAGNSALESGDYEAALAAFTCAIEADTTNYDARLGRIYAYLLSGQYARNVPDWVAITYSYPSVWPEAIARYSSAIEVAPNELLLYVQRSYANWATQGFQQAVADYDRILELDTENTYALLFRGTSYLLLYDEEAAAADFERVLALAPDNPHVYATIGFFYSQRGDEELGLENLNRAIQLDPEMADFYISRGILFEQRMSDYEEAVADYSRAIELAPEEPSYYYWRGLVYRDRMVNFDDEAVADFTRAIELDPNQSALYLDRAETYHQLGDRVSGAADMERYITLVQREVVDQTVEGVEASQVEMTLGRVYQIPLQMEAGQHFTVRALSSDCIPILLLLDGNGTPLIASDIISGSYSIQRYLVPVDGTYTLLMSHALEFSEGEISLTFDLG